MKRRRPCRPGTIPPPGNLLKPVLSRLRSSDYGSRDGLFTGYYEIELDGSRRRHGQYQTPLYRKPSDLGLRRPDPCGNRGWGARRARAASSSGSIDPIDAFFLQIQGSGRVRLDKGGTMRVGYDGQNGQPYVPVGRLLLERGMIPRDKLTMPAIRRG